MTTKYGETSTLPVRLQEPWYRSRGNGAVVCNADGPLLRVGCGHGKASEILLARRVIACVNACEGFSTEELERFTRAGGRIKMLLPKRPIFHDLPPAPENVTTPLDHERAAE